MVNRPLLLVGLCCIVLAHCGGGGTGYNPGSPDPTPSPTPTPVGVTAADLQFCVDSINQLRARVGKPALAHSSTLDAYGQKSATNDGQSGLAHEYYRSNNGGGVSLAENEVIAWSLTEFHSVQGVITASDDDLFWAEGPGGGHYQNIVGPYTQAGCGVYVNGQAVTVTTEFR